MLKQPMRHVSVLLALPLCLSSVSFAGMSKDSGYYTEPPVYDLRPKSTGEFHFGHVGATGLVLAGERGVQLKVEKTTPGSPADGKFRKGETITGVNGTGLKGRNPYVVLGEALTQAEAKGGTLVFDVAAGEGAQTKKVEVTIPVLGAYSPTWPLQCAKSKAIIDRMAGYYAKNVSDKHIEGALACLYLLSTGDDQYLPMVKARLKKIAGDVKKSDHTWYNGYNGVLFCEYYLRTGDAEVLPVIQALCDDSRDRQIYGLGWRHWGAGANPRYMDGSLLNAACGPLVMFLLLAKECPVEVDEATLQGALKFWFRFAGHGAVAYGDYRGEGGVFSNGKDGMGAVIMQLASGARGDGSLYQKARDSFAAAMIDSYPGMLIGHGDWGRSDAAWRGISVAYRRDPNPAEYQAVMNRLAWWHDISRRPSGGMGVSGLTESFDEEGSGAGVALSYTAPLKTLRITGAPRSKHAKEFSLPALSWGRKADLDFLSTEHAKGYGTEEPAHIPYYRFGTAYVAPQEDPAKLDRKDIVKYVRHRNYVIRAQAAKALKNIKAYDELERLLSDPDRRVRRAALDGMFDTRFNNDTGKNPMPPEKITPGMLAAIRAMLADPDEAIFVIDGALQALSIAPPKEIKECLPFVLPWVQHDEWWLRHSAFIALSSAAKDKAHASELLPVLGDMLSRESRPSARNNMLARMNKLAQGFKGDRELSALASAAYQKATGETKILPGKRSSEGGFPLARTVEAAVDFDHRNALPIAQTLQPRMREIPTGYLKDVAEKLMSVLGDLPAEQRGKLVDLLYSEYRLELVRRMQRDGVLPGGSASSTDGDAKAEPKEAPNVDTLASLTSLKNANAAWRDIGTPAGGDRMWKYHSFSLKDRVAEKGRATFAPPTGMEKWFSPGFDDSAWKSGLAPVGKGKFKPAADDDTQLAGVHRSPWGKGEFLILRTVVDVDSLDYDFVRLRVLANKGFRIYLNGRVLEESVPGYMGRKTDAFYQTIPLKTGELKSLKPGKNVIAAYARSNYDAKNVKGEPGGYFDMRLQGLKISDLLAGAPK